MKWLASVLLATTLGGCSGWRLKGSRSAVEEQQDSIVPPKPKQFAKVVPTNEPSAVFLVNGEPLCFMGSNNYYLTFKSKAMIDDVFANAQKLNIKVLRQWAHIDRGSLDGRVPSVDNDGTKEGIYFQYWDTKAGKPAYNDGEDGLVKLDYVLAKARESGVRIVMVMTNNWIQFGGVDQYLAWYGLSKHPAFYTDERVTQAYKDWARHLIGRVNSINGIWADQWIKDHVREAPRGGQAHGTS